MLSRVAESIYWINRYMERIENYARFIWVNLNMIPELPPDMPEQWEPLVRTTGDYDLFISGGNTPDKVSVLNFLTFDHNNPNSIVNCLGHVRENARTIREHLSTELWRFINSFYLEISGADKMTLSEIDNLSEWYTKIRLNGHTFNGILDHTMSHNDLWYFSQIGKYIERADKTARILDIKYFILLPDVKYIGTPLDILQWTALLRSASAFEMYRKKYHSINPDNVVDFLVLDNSFPRSIHYCLIQAEIALHKLTQVPTWTYSNPAEKELGQARSLLDYGDISDIFSVGLHEYLDSMQIRLIKIGDYIHQTFFAWAAPANAREIKI